MIYRLSSKELNRLTRRPAIYDFYDAEMLQAVFYTDSRIVSELVPRPLKPADDAFASVFVASYPRTSFGSVYNEGALLLRCTYKGEEGWYCLSMPVDDDMAMIGGREGFGYPKKIADLITLETNGDTATGSVTRKGTEILRITAQLEGEVEGDFMTGLATNAVDWNGARCYNLTNFLFKYFNNPGGTGFDYLPRLIREPVLFRANGPIRSATGEVALTSTAQDPFGIVPVGEIIGMNYGKWDNTMLPGRVVSRVWNPLRFAKYAFAKTDFAAALEEEATIDGKRAREIAKALRKY